MPDTATLKRAHRDAQQGKSESTQAGEFVRDEIHHIREGRHGARSTKQAIAIGLSEARRAGVRLPPSRSSPPSVRNKAQRELEKGAKGAGKSPRRSGASLRALRKEGRAAASPRALSKQARAAARARSSSERAASARRGARTRMRAAA